MTAVKRAGERATNLGGEDVVGDVPDPLAAVDVGVAHAFHFAEDGAHRCVRGLVSLLVDEHPPAWGWGVGAEREHPVRPVGAHTRVQPTGGRHPGGRTHTGGGIGHYSAAQLHTPAGTCLWMEHSCAMLASPPAPTFSTWQCYESEPIFQGLRSRDLLFSVIFINS